MRRIGLVVLFGLAGCSSNNDDATGTTCGGQVLDPAQPHYGKTYAEWATEFWKWIYGYPAGSDKDCRNPLLDTTGDGCAVGQDPNSPVFFLAGNGGATVVRSRCVVPVGKALFFPIVNTEADNAGVPPEKSLKVDEMKAQLASFFDAVVVPDLKVFVDGRAIPNLAAYKTGPTQFTYAVPPEPNAYTCFGATGISGTIDPAVDAGYYMMLDPLCPGEHTVQFVGHVRASPDDFHLDVTYKLTVR